MTKKKESAKKKAPIKTETPISNASKKISKGRGRPFANNITEDIRT